MPNNRAYPDIDPALLIEINLTRFIDEVFQHISELDGPFLTISVLNVRTQEIGSQRWREQFTRLHRPQKAIKIASSDICTAIR